MLTLTQLSFYKDSIIYATIRGYIVNARNTHILCFDSPDVIANLQYLERLLYNKNLSNVIVLLP